MKTSIGLALGSLWLLSVYAPASAASYHIAHELPLDGEAGFDDLKVDSSGRVFVTRGTFVQVIDADGSRVIGVIPDTPGVHSIAFAEDLGRGYISAGRSSNVIVFDLKTLARLNEIKTTGENPDAIIYDSNTHRVLSFNGRGRNATVIDAVKNEVIGTIALDAKPEFAAADDAGTVYVNLEDKNSVAAIDAKTMTILHVWPIAGCDGPTGLALDRAHRRLFSVCSNKIMAVIDAGSRRVVATVPIGGFVDGAAFDPGEGLAFASAGEGTITIVHEDAPDRFSVVQTLPTQPGARTMTLDERTHRVYVSTATYKETAPAPGAPQSGPRFTAVPGSYKLLTIEP
jgi:DNA-binding beta-propeller fold protein YncE